MKVDIHICSYFKHFNYLFYCLKSILKFSEGFNSVKLLIPTRDSEFFYKTVPYDIKVKIGDFIKIIEFEEWENKGMLHHEYKVLTADIDCPESDYILHFDSDCIFTSKIHANNFFENNKPILYYESYENLAKREPNILNWQIAVKNALGWQPENEFMRSRFLIYKKNLYSHVRELIEQNVKIPLDEYIKSQRNEFPQTFAEYPTLGEVAWIFFRNDYYWIDSSDFKKIPFHIYEIDTKIRQMWSHGDFTKEDKQIFEKIGL
jgi:hypothetical protein